MNAAHRLERGMGLLALLLALVGATGCATARVPLTNEWPSSAGEYHAVTREWTRSASLSQDYQLVISAEATLLSAPWRAAKIEREARLRGLGPAARQALLATEQERAQGPWEIELLVTTWDRKENDLHRGARASWRVALLDEQGNEIAPMEITRDRRPPHVVRAEFAHLGDFAQAYVVRFAKEVPLLGPGVRRVRLRVTSARGAVELVWLAP